MAEAIEMNKNMYEIVEQHKLTEKERKTKIMDVTIPAEFIPSEPISVDFSDMYVPEAAPANIETQVQITKAFVRKNKEKTRNMVVVTLKCPLFEKALPFTEYISYPNNVDDANARNLMKLRLNSFMTAFGLPTYSPIAFNPATGEATQLVGRAGWAVLNVELGTDGMSRNSIKTFCAPKGLSE
jgi:hypothetical protein